MRSWARTSAPCALCVPRALGTALTLVFVVGCSARASRGGGEPTGSTASAIQGGTVDKNDNYAVGVCGTDGKPGTCAYVCSGVLIAPNLVATARHCVDEASDLTVACAGDTFGGPLLPESDYWITTDYDMLQSTQGWHQTQSIVVPPATSFCGNDLALLILKDSVAADEATPATPLVQYPLTDADVVSGSETAIGYGDTSATTNSYGTRHERQNIPILCIPGDETAPCAPVSQSNIAADEFAAGDGPCDGDSGSGAYEQSSYNQGMPLVLGVLSRGGAEGTSCSGSVYTRFDVYRDLLIQTVTKAASVGGYALPAWTQPAPLGADGEGEEGGLAEGGGSATCDGSEGNEGTDCTTAQASKHSGGCSAAPGPPDAVAGLAILGGFALLGRGRGRPMVRKTRITSDAERRRSIGL